MKGRSTPHSKRIRRNKSRRISSLPFRTSTSRRRPTGDVQNSHISAGRPDRAVSGTFRRRNSRRRTRPPPAIWKGEHRSAPMVGWHRFHHCAPPARMCTPGVRSTANVRPARGATGGQRNAP
jgi:hypothetical protein